METLAVDSPRQYKHLQDFQYFLKEIWKEGDRPGMSYDRSISVFLGYSYRGAPFEMTPEEVELIKKISEENSSTHKMLSEKERC